VQSSKHHLSSWVCCHVAVTSDIMCGIMCCTSRKDNMGGLEHTRKQIIRTELVPSMAYVSAFIAFVRVPPQNPTLKISVNKEVNDAWCMTSVPFNSRDVIFWFSQHCMHLETSTKLFHIFR